MTHRAPIVLPRETHERTALHGLSCFYREGGIEAVGGRDARTATTSRPNPCWASLLFVHCAQRAETPYPSAVVMFSKMAVIP
jgi:hypothetical protein